MNYPQNPLGVLAFHIQLAPWMLWAVLWAFLTVYGIISVILFYHWIAYGMRAKGILIAEFVFPIVSAIFIYMAVVGIATI